MYKLLTDCDGYVILENQAGHRVLAWDSGVAEDAQSGEEIGTWSWDEETDVYRVDAEETSTH